jgi:hypothetical protein
MTTHRTKTRDALSTLAVYTLLLGLRGPPVRWRATYRWLSSDEIKFFKTNTSTSHSGKLSE